VRRRMMTSEEELAQLWANSEKARAVRENWVKEELAVRKKNIRYLRNKDPVCRCFNLANKSVRI